MPTNFPGALDTTSNLPSTPDPFVANSTPGHLSHPPTAHGAIRALEAKLGIGASTPPSAPGRFLTSDGAGGSQWQVPLLVNSDPTDTDYTLVLADAGTAVSMVNGATVRIPNSSSVAWVRGMTLLVVQLGTGAVTVSPNAGVTVRAAFTPPYTLRAQNSVGTLTYRGGNEWLIYGDFL